tara:strand:+ start:1344 stop:2312 length:969 start_codon:yes stop_codon:yes gene_type:complete
MLVYAPLESVDMRYTTHLDNDIRKYLKKYYKKEYTILDPDTFNTPMKKGQFLNAKDTIFRQFNQFNLFLSLLVKGKIPKDTIYFTTDIWNIAVLSIPYINFFEEYNIKLQGVLHAGSFTDTDFVREMERQYKGFEESIFDIADKIFVASEFIKNDVIKKRYVNPDKIISTGLPLNENLDKYKPKTKKENIIIFNGRNCDEKQPYLLEEVARINPTFKCINTQLEGLSKNEYYELLNKSKIVISFALQENFGYGIQEAVKLGCIPILPNRLVYPELYKKEYLYNNFLECNEMINKVSLGKIKQPKQIVNNVKQYNKSIFNTWF